MKGWTDGGRREMRKEGRDGEELQGRMEGQREQGKTDRGKKEGRNR